MKLVRERERGSATVVSLTLVAALVVLLVLAGTIAGIVQRRAHLQGAADLAALAAAADWNHHHVPNPCEKAHAVAQRNAVQVRECDVLGASVQVVVEPNGRQLGPARAVARAGPPERAATAP